MVQIMVKFWHFLQKKKKAYTKKENYTIIKWGIGGL